MRMGVLCAKNKYSLPLKIESPNKYKYSSSAEEATLNNIPRYWKFTHIQTK
jgi:hypothetical protein